MDKVNCETVHETRQETVKTDQETADSADSEPVETVQETVKLIVDSVGEEAVETVEIFHRVTAEITEVTVKTVLDREMETGEGNRDSS